jgi:hypothetical protein
MSFSRAEDLLEEIDSSIDAIGDITIVKTLLTPVIYNVALTNANAEYSQQLPVTCSRFAVRIQDGVGTDNFRIAYATGKVATPTAPFLKISADAEYEERDVLGSAQLTLYIASSAAGKDPQIIAWY